ncbi:hypothetical protein [Moheibacter sediminis]|nr:hypothetical protein [Moheibacter sediminis]
MPTIVSSAPLTVNDYTGFGLYHYDDIYDASKWHLIPGLNSSIDIEFDNNIIDIDIEGTVQMGSIDFDTGEYISYGIGIFVNDHLVAARVFNLRGTANNNESMKWEVHGQVENLAIGSNDVKVAINKRGRSGTFTGDFVVAGSSTAPSTTPNLNSFQSKAYLQVKGNY